MPQDQPLQLIIACMDWGDKRYNVSQMQERLKEEGIEVSDGEVIEALNWLVKGGVFVMDLRSTGEVVFYRKKR